MARPDDEIAFPPSTWLELSLRAEGYRLAPAASTIVDSLLATAASECPTLTRRLRDELISRREARVRSTNRDHLDPGFAALIEPGDVPAGWDEIG